MKCRIAVCGSDEASRAIFSDRLKDYDGSCQLFSSPEELTGALCYCVPDVLFIRSELGGSRIAPCVAALREIAPDCALLLVSNSSRGAELAFALEADDFLPVPISQEALDAALARAFMKRPWVFRTLPHGVKKTEIRLKDI
ncbi:MAG: hypothetical protein J5449_06045, partial [Oscillospiraceae bacterium]|nr:hypothetical protein [Oscillospiraceae bacterium]